MLPEKEILVSILSKPKNAVEISKAWKRVAGKSPSTLALCTILRVLSDEGFLAVQSYPEEGYRDSLIIPGLKVPNKLDTYHLNWEEVLKSL